MGHPATLTNVWVNRESQLITQVKDGALHVAALPVEKPWVLLALLLSKCVTLRDSLDFSGS